jgi:hypothetical protein
MRFACLFLLLLSGCETAAAIDRADIIAALAVRYGALAVRKSAPQPTPDVPSEGCVDGCRCNGTGREKTGDGLSEVDCRCPAGCDCKPAQSESAATPAVEPDPLPLVAIPQAEASSSCADGSCTPQPVQTYRTTRLRLFRR